MGTRSNDLADRLDATADDIIAAVEDLSDENWAKVAPADGRQINVIVHHVAQSQQAVFMLAEMILAGKPLPNLSLDMIHDANQQHAAENHQIGKEEALVALRVNTEVAANRIRELTDEQLDTVAPFSFSESGQITPEGVVEYIMIGHAQDHLGSILAALA